jgi:hypothetical protein
MPRTSRPSWAHGLLLAASQVHRLQLKAARCLSRTIPVPALLNASRQQL